MPAPAPLTLGDFTLDRVIGRGGMAEVWLGTHRTLGVQAALKVVKSALADDAGFVDGFHREVRAVAGLDHPGVVGVFDTGLIDEATAAASGERFRAGTPWLAMEYASGGDVSSWVVPLSWPRLHATVLEILDALAHAHARGVIHRDLKPANILVRGAGTQRALMLTDFGIAHVVEPSLDSDAVGATSSGTPHYMAPEQVRGQWRDYGPWTDLYALGCLTYELACGKPPFPGSNPVSVAVKQVGAPAPPLGETRGAPPAFAAWVARLLAKRPEDRFECAADAAWALAQIPAPRGASSLPASGGLRELATRPTVPASRLGTLAVVVDTALLDRVAPTGELPRISPESTAAPPPAPPPMPPTWRLPDTPTSARVLGTGLFAVRETPFVGREAERDALWAALRRVRAEGTSHAVLVESGVGSGKSRLVDWLTRRAEEVGAATVVRVDHGPLPSPLEGVVAAMRSWFRGDELDRAALGARIETRLRQLLPDLPAEQVTGAASGLAALLDPTPDASGRATDPAEQRAAIAFWLREATARRPLVLRISNAHFGLESLALSELLLDGPDAPILILATLRPDRVAEQPDIAEIIERIGAHPRAERLALGPLSPDDRARYVEALLGLSPQLVEAVRAGTAGDPWFAEQVVADWIERALLVPGPEGYDAAEPVTVPPSADAVVEARFDRLVDGFEAPDRVRRALEAAAALGHAVDRGEWRRLCALLGVPPSRGRGSSSREPRLVSALADRGWIRLLPSGWAWSHDAWRAAMLRSAEAAGRTAAVHRACARMLRTARPSAMQSERIARHLEAAGETADAREALFAAARQWLETGDYRRAVRLGREVAGATDDDVLRSRALALRADGLRYLNRPEEAAAILADIAGHTHPAVRAEWARITAGITHFSGQLERGFALYDEAARLYREVGDVVGEVRSIHGRGWCLQAQGRYPESRAEFEAGAARARSAGEELEEAWCLHGLASNYVWVGERGSIEPAERALAIFERLGARGGEAAARMFVGEGLGHEGRFDEAWRMYDAAIEIWTALRSNFLSIGLGGKALMLLDAGLLDEAAEVLDRVPATGFRVPPQFLPLYVVARAVIDARRGAPSIEPLRRIGVGQTIGPRMRGMLIEVAGALRDRPAEAREALLLAARSVETHDPPESARLRAMADAIIEASAIE